MSNPCNTLIVPLEDVWDGMYDLKGNLIDILSLAVVH